jgi:hypothetical protein
MFGHWFYLKMKETWATANRENQAIRKGYSPKPVILNYNLGKGPKAQTRWKLVTFHQRKR